jgi:hypothetical protein
MKLFGARANQVGTVLALENAAFFVFFKSLKLFHRSAVLTARSAVFPSRKTNSMMAIGGARAKSCQLDCSVPVRHACNRLGSLVSEYDNSCRS